MKEHIRQSILKTGFDACGFTDSSALPEFQQYFFEYWIKNHYHAGMQYMENNLEKRMHPNVLVKGAKSIIVIALNYFPKHSQLSSYKIAKYAYGEDYHDVIKQKLSQIVNQIPELKNDPVLRIFTDSAPLAERFLAAKAGIGFIGKNNSLIIPQKGSYFFLAEIVTGIELNPDKPFLHKFCGNCTRCLDACPTQALIKPYTLDARKCISYLTIEHKTGFIMPSTKKESKKWIFGCDACLEACPWNRFATYHETEKLHLSDSLLSISDKDWENLSQEKFKQIFTHSPLQRAGYEKLMQNIALYRNKKH